MKTIKQSLNLINNGRNRFFLPKYISYTQINTPHTDKDMHIQTKTYTYIHVFGHYFASFEKGVMSQLEN